MESSCGCEQNLPSTFPMEGDQVAFIRDNTGNLVELIQQS